MNSDESLINLDQYEYLEMENEEEIIEENSDQIATTILQDIYNINNKTQDDLDLIALVEGNPRLYTKGKAGYKNTQEKEMSWISIGKALKHPLSEQQSLSGSGRDNVSYENLLTPQSMAIHRFMGHLYVPRKTLSNYTKSMASHLSSSDSENKVPPRPLSKLLLKKRLQLSFTDSKESTLLENSPINFPTCKRKFVDNISKNKKLSDYKSIDSQASDCSIKVPTSDIKKGKKRNLEIDSMIKESSQTIAAACSVLLTFLNTTSKTNTEEDGLISFLSNGLKRVPVQQKIRCVIKILEVLESFQKSE